MMGKVSFIIIAFSITQCFGDNDLKTRMFPAELGNTSVGIFNGIPTTIEQHPYLVAIVLDNKFFFCSGAIVGATWIVTSADCVYGIDPDRMMAFAGSNGSWYGPVYSIRDVYLHPQFGNTPLDYEYACLSVYGHFPWSSSVKLAALPSNNPAINSTMTVAGWGTTNPSGRGRSSSVLLEGTMEWLDFDTCADYYSDFDIEWTERLSCAFDKGHTTLCSGDWGGPVVQDGVLYGMYIAVAGEGSCSPDASPTILSNIYPVTSWIRAVTGAEMEQ